MKKGLLIGVVLVVIIIGGAAYFGGGALQGLMGGGDSLAALPGASVAASGAQLPTRAAEIRGTVKSVEGDKLVVARAKDDPMTTLTEEERAAKRKEMLKLSFEERMQRRQQELQGLETEDVTVIVPVGIPITKSGSGPAQLDGGEEAALDTIRVGANLTIWTENGKTDNATAEYVRILVGQ